MIRLFSVAALGRACLLTLLACHAAQAHVVCGARTFAATLTMDDPGVGDELSLPTLQYLPVPATNGNPSGSTTDYGFEWDKTITKDLAVAINGDYFTQRGAGQSLSGWNNFSLTLKDELPCFAEHELALSIGVVHTFARTGSGALRAAGAIDSTSTTTPTVYIGKGLGDLPIGYLRAFSVTGELGYQISDAPGLRPDQWQYAASLQYSIPYLDQNVKALGLPAFLSRLVPLVEFSFTSPIHGQPTGTIAPGLLYEADAWQAGVEAIIPANAATRQAQGTGFVAQFHLFLDDILPGSLGKPLFNTNLWR